MKYIYNPVTNNLDEIDKIEVNKDSKTPVQPHRESSKTKQIPKVKEKTDVLDYINRMQYMYGDAPLNEDNKRRDLAAADAAKRNKIDPNRPALSASDVVFASMDSKEAAEFVGTDPEKIKHMRSIQAKVHRQNDYDKRKIIASENNKKIIAGVPMEEDKNLETVLEVYPEPIRPDLTKRTDPDLAGGVASLIRKKF